MFVMELWNCNFGGFRTVDTGFHIKLKFLIGIYIYIGCPRRNGQNFGRVFLMLNYTDITKTPISKVERLRR